MKISLFVTLIIASACGRISASMVSQSTPCVAMVSATNKVELRYFYSFGTKAGRGFRCELNSAVQLCSSAPAVETDAGYEIQFKQENNSNLLNVVRGGSEECLLIEDLGGTRKILVSADSIKVTGEVRKEIPLNLPPAVTPAPHSQPMVGEFAVSDSIVSEARRWVGSYFRRGVKEQCAEFVRAVLSRACNPRFATNNEGVLFASRPWDFDILGPNAGYGPTLADSLASSEYGARISSVSALLPGDLVFLKNTYGEWSDGVITHIGIYAGDGYLIDRSTFLAPVAKRPLKTPYFAGGLRLYRSLCR